MHTLKSQLVSSEGFIFFLSKAASCSYEYVFKIFDILSIYLFFQFQICQHSDHNTRAILYKLYEKKYVGIVRIGVRMSQLAILTTKYTLLTSIPHNIVFVPTYLTFHENFQSSVPVDREAIRDRSQQVCLLPSVLDISKATFTSQIYRASGLDEREARGQCIVLAFSCRYVI